MFYVVENNKIISLSSIKRVYDKTSDDEICIKAVENFERGNRIEVKK